MYRKFVFSYPILIKLGMLADDTSVTCFKHLNIVIVQLERCLEIIDFLYAPSSASEASVASVRASFYYIKLAKMAKNYQKKKWFM